MLLISGLHVVFRYHLWCLRGYAVVVFWLNVTPSLSYGVPLEDENACSMVDGVSEVLCGL